MDKNWDKIHKDYNQWLNQTIILIPDWLYYLIGITSLFLFIKYIGLIIGSFFLIIIFIVIYIIAHRKGHKQGYMDGYDSAIEEHFKIDN